MGMKPNFVSWFDGTQPLSTQTTTAFAAGQPVRLDSTGVALALSTNSSATYVGLARAPRATFVAAGSNAAYAFGACQVNLFDNSANDSNDGSPLATRTFTRGELLYVDANGQWDNVDPGSAKARGIVVEVYAASGIEPAGIRANFFANVG